MLSATALGGLAELWMPQRKLLECRAARKLTEYWLADICTVYGQLEDEFIFDIWHLLTKLFKAMKGIYFYYC